MKSLPNLCEIDVKSLRKRELRRVLRQDPQDYEGSCGKIGKIYPGSRMGNIPRELNQGPGMGNIPRELNQGSREAPRGPRKHQEAPGSQAAINEFH